MGLLQRGGNRLLWAHRAGAVCGCVGTSVMLLRFWLSGFGGGVLALVAGYGFCYCFRGKRLVRRGLQNVALDGRLRGIRGCGIWHRSSLIRNGSPAGDLIAAGPHAGLV